ncbi:MAG: copper amine oxidase N-terminal domain-containing protein [Defluviitaleaceae bacterium]|nr:copper amine oxidase N-terminal domain-containing protein [Defluviitaleaceae bacterium]
MKKEHLKGFVAGVLLMVMLSATLVFASPGISREIHYGISIVLNGRTVQFDEDSQPFIMDDRTFLPLRTMADLLGLPVDFNPDTNTAYLGHAAIEGFLIGGAWDIEYDEYETLVERIEFFADGTGIASMFRLYDAATLDAQYFAWGADGNIITLAFPYDDYYEFHFAIYRSVFGDSEMLLLTDYDGWTEILVRNND